MSHDEQSENKKNSIESHFAYQFADLIIVFIGLSLFFLPAISAWSSIPREFIFGATLSSFLLALSDGLLIKDKMSFRRFCFYGFCFVFGVLSLIYVPVILSMYPQVFPAIEPFSDVLTISALGFVLVVVGIRSYNYKKKFQENLRNDLVQVQLETQKQLAELQKIKDMTTKFEENLETNSQGIENSRVEIDKITKDLITENEDLRKQLEKYENQNN
ncbi:hypothetical protein BBI11_09810 [Planococcus maritimus]|uniref:hypothetical protein n=1 Tax=Planococcus maritimus TaxID=192421 RepID=UPI00080EFB6F|nr:hypothetical protein [Planococcus maritimus]ANU17297.1 hypothetical protein BBI11_09810 [Planococcus maritimus]